MIFLAPGMPDWKQLIAFPIMLCANYCVLMVY